MAEPVFPNTFSQELVPLSEFDLNPRGRQAVDGLAAQGLTIYSGITEDRIPEIVAIAETDPVKEYCPRDVSRFSQPEEWLAKGRGAFMLVDDNTNELVGYSWTGVEPCHELPEHPVTTAFRSTVAGTGLHQVIATVEGSRAVHGAHHLGLETWASNRRAVRTYIKAGCTLVDAVSEVFDKELGDMAPIKRPTLKETEATYWIDNTLYRPDTRLFMAFPEPESSTQTPASSLNSWAPPFPPPGTAI